MAVVTRVTQDLIFGSSVTSWGPMATGDTGDPVGVPGSGDRTVQVSGTFGGASVIIEGTLDMTNWQTLHDPAVTILSFTSAGLAAVLENVLAVRPRISGGSAVAVNVVLLTRKSQNG